MYDPTFFKRLLTLPFFMQLFTEWTVGNKCHIGNVGFKIIQLIIVNICFRETSLKGGMGGTGEAPYALAKIGHFLFFVIKLVSTLVKINVITN